MTTTDRQGAGFWEQGEFGVFPGGIPVRRIGGENNAQAQAQAQTQQSTPHSTAQHSTPRTAEHRHSKARLAQQSRAKHACPYLSVD